jgi:predicted ester cyclase
MTVQEQNKALVKRFNKEVIEQQNLDVFHEMVSPAFINQTAPPGMQNQAATLHFFKEILWPALQDIRVEIYEQLAEGEKVVTRKVLHATHVAEFMGIPASGKKVSLKIIDIVRLQDGKYVEHWAVLDTASMVA